MAVCVKCKQDIPMEEFTFCPFCGKKQSKPEKKERNRKSRGNSCGSVYKRGSSWVASVTLGWKSTSPDKPPYPIKRTKSFKTKSEALDAIPLLKLEKPKTVPALSFYWESYKATGYKKLSDSTQCKYRIAWEKRLALIHDTPVNELSVKVLQDVIDRNKPSYDQAKDCRNLLSNLYRLIVADGNAASKDIPALLNLPAHEEKEREVFTDDEMKKLWTCYENGNIDCAIPLFMLYSGAMPGETMHLRTDQIDLDRRIIVGAGMKTKVRRETPIVIADCLVPVLEDLIARARPDGYLWIQSKDDFYQMFNDALTAAGIERKLTPYCCRHSFAHALAVTENIAPATIRRAMRWSTTRMLDRYSHPDNTDALDAVDKLKK